MFRAIQVEDLDEELTWQWLEDETIQIAILICSIFPTEKALKKHIYR